MCCAPKAESLLRILSHFLPLGIVTLALIVTLLSPSVVVVAEDTSEITSTAQPPQTTTTEKQNCTSRGTECSVCVEDVSCYYCASTKQCKHYPGSRILPSDECSLSDTRWAICWLNFEALIISVSVIGAVLLITISCTIYCCCCRSNSGRLAARWARDDRKAEQKREELRLKHEERRSDRKAKNDEIRRKYGLVKDDNPYMKFENDKP